MVALLQSALSKNLHSNIVTDLLAAFNPIEGKKLTCVQSLIEPLSQRELEVLQSLATGLPNQAIADQLFVSLAAIKWHACNIYSKLQVNNRTQALTKARELGLLP
jgi:LuxR family maltose regulon positive regulatory protein